MVRLLTGGRRAAWTILPLAAGLLAAAPAAAGDPAHGKGVFAAQCAMCHSAAPHGATLVGPPLSGIVGRKAGTFAGYAFSPAMRGAGFAWSDERLRAYLPAPAKLLPGIKMSYGGVKNPAQLEDLIAYLDTLK